MHIENANEHASENVSDDSDCEHDSDATAPSESIYDNTRAYLRKHDSPRVLMPLPGGYYETYLAALLVALHGVPGVKKAVLAHEFTDLGFSPTWFRGDAITMDRDVTLVDGHDLRFLLEVQRVFTFLDESSDRAFASLANLVRNLPKDALKEFINVDTLAEAYDVFYKTLVHQLSLVGIESSHFFTNALEESDEDQLRELGMYHIEAEEVKRTLYKSLAELIWGDWVDTTHSVSRLADVMMISIDPCVDDVSFIPPGLELPEKFYPQIFTKEFEQIIVEIKEQHDTIERERAAINKELMKLKTHRGKNVQAVLEHSLEFLQDDSNNFTGLDTASALENLQQLKVSLQDKREELITRNSILLEANQKYSTSNVDFILSQHSRIHPDSTPEPYILTGVLLNGRTYCTLENKTGKWMYVEHTHANDPDTNYSTGEIGMSELQNAVQSVTKSSWRDPMVFIYVKESALQGQSDVELPAASREFLKLDREELEKSTEWVMTGDVALTETESEGSVVSEEKQQPEQPSLIDLEE